VAFLTLRDVSADLSVTATCPRRVVELAQPPLTEGARVVVFARPSYYLARGTLSLAVSEIRPVGLGALLAQLEQRKSLLAAEGLFAAERKRPLPFLPRVVGLISGRASAAERDVVENAVRRWPGVRFAHEEVAVQGPRAVAEVCSALQRLDREPLVDVIVVARGGGSVEDLLPFSDEVLVRAVSATLTPVVSAIGHEQDVPLLDLVADVRASTPTDAARRVVPDVDEQHELLTRLRRRAWQCASGLVQRETSHLAALRSRPVLADPRSLLTEQLSVVLGHRDRAVRAFAGGLDTRDDDVRHTFARVSSLSPKATLERGYAVVQDIRGSVVISPGDIAVNDSVYIRLAAGGIGATVTDVDDS
jgi:exodeoxyribonuclease VII large subunit